MFIRWIAFLALSLALTTLPGDVCGQDRPPVRPVVAGSPLCELWSSAVEVIGAAEREIGKLPNGVITLYHAERPLVIEPLIRFAYERQELARRLEGDPDLAAKLGGACGHNLSLMDPGLHIEISASAHGFFAILTSENRTTVKLLHQDAKRSVQLNVPVRF